MRPVALLLAGLAWGCNTSASTQRGACTHDDPVHGAPSDSIEELETRLAHGADLPDGCRLALLRSLIDACAQIPDPEAGLRHVDEALALAPHETWLWFKRGVVLDAMGELEQAVQAFDAALRLDPQHVKSLEWRAHVELEQGRPAEALVDLERALVLLPATDPAGIREDLATLERALRIEKARALDALGRHAEANAVRGAL